MSNFFLRVALPPSGIPRKILRTVKEYQKSGETLFVYMFQEKVPFKAKVGPRKKDAYMSTCMWMILSSKPVKSYQNLRWRDACERFISSERENTSGSGCDISCSASDRTDV